LCNKSTVRATTNFPPFLDRPDTFFLRTCLPELNPMATEKEVENYFRRSDRLYSIIPNTSTRSVSKSVEKKSELIQLCQKQLAVQCKGTLSFIGLCFSVVMLMSYCLQIITMLSCITKINLNYLRTLAFMMKILINYKSTRYLYIPRFAENETNKLFFFFVEQHFDHLC
jgi:hypothetical protein